MRAILFSFDLFDKHFDVHMWGLMLGLGVVAALVGLSLLCKYYKIDEKVYDFYFWNGVVAVGFGIFGAWAFQQLYDTIAGRPFWPLTGGFTFMGGLVFGAASFIFGTYKFANPKAKHEFYRIANFAAPCIVLAHTFGRFGCFFAGCCYGKPSEHGLIFPDGPSKGQRVLPTQLYEAIFLLVLLGAMLLILFYFKRHEFLLILYGFAYAIFRFIIEFFRGDYRGGAEDALLSPSQWQSIFLLAVIIGLTVLVYRYNIIPFRQPAFANKPAQPLQISETTASEDETPQPAMTVDETPQPAITADEPMPTENKEP